MAARKRTGVPIVNPLADAPRTDLRDLKLLDFIPAISPELTRPDHWRVIGDVLERAIRGDLRVVFSAPVQHGKSVLGCHAVPWWHVQDETLSIFYVTYAQQFTEIQSRTIRRLTEAVGCRFRDDHKRLDGWSFEAGGRAVMTSIEGPGTGLPGNIFVVDDPFKGPSEAYSAQRRQHVYDWYRYVLTARRAPKASHIIIASRWDEDDLSGRLIRDHGYTEIRLPAICDDPATDPNKRQLGQALCPSGPNPKEPRDLVFLADLRKEIGEHAFHALCQGRPIPNDGALFQRAPVVRPMPMTFRTAIGLDLGFSTKGDFTAIVPLHECATTGDITIGKVQRIRKRSPEVAAALFDVQAEWPTAEIFSYVSGGEVGTVNLLADMGLWLTPMPARYNKFVRAQNTAAAWQSGRIGVPAVASWDMRGFLMRLRSFTGEEGGIDDEADALVSGFDGLACGAEGGLQPGFYGRRCI